MPNWCNNSVAFFQNDGGKAMIEAFYTDINRYQDYKDPETDESPAWVGHWLKSNRVDANTVYSRGFFTSCILNEDHVRIDMETAWGPLQEVWDLMADKYDLVYVYIAEEPGCEVYVNTDDEGRFFVDRYLLHCFDVDDLELDPRILEEYGDHLYELSGDTTYFTSWEEVIKIFEPFNFNSDDINTLNEHLEMFGITVYEYSSE